MAAASASINPSQVFRNLHLSSFDEFHTVDASTEIEAFLLQCNNIKIPDQYSLSKAYEAVISSGVQPHGGPVVQDCSS